jgi:hypothetical protein
MSLIGAINQRREIEWTHIGERRFSYACARTYVSFARSNTRNLRFVKSIDRNAIAIASSSSSDPYSFFILLFIYYTIIASRQAEYAMNTQTIICNLRTDIRSILYVKKANM